MHIKSKAIPCTRWDDVVWNNPTMVGNYVRSACGLRHDAKVFVKSLFGPLFATPNSSRPDSKDRIG